MQRKPEAVPNSSFYKDDEIPGVKLSQVATEAKGALQVYMVEPDGPFFCYTHEKYYNYASPRKEISGLIIKETNDAVTFMNKTVPQWADVHRAMALTATDFSELQDNQSKQQKQEKSEPEIRLFGGKNDEELMLDLPSVSSTSPKQKMLHLGLTRVEKVEQELYVRVYLAVWGPETSQIDQKTTHEYTAHKDVHMGNKGEIKIFGTGVSGSPSRVGTEKMYLNFGQPLRAYAWAKKYETQDPGLSKPTVRSFLVPFGLLKTLMFGSVREDEMTKQDLDRFQNSDYERLPNQFGIGGKALEAIRVNALPGSLITYSDHVDVKDQKSGQVKPLSELGAQLGVPTTPIKGAEFSAEGGETGFRPARLNPKIPPKFIEQAKRTRPSSLVADELQLVSAHWFGKAALLPDDVKALGDRTAVVSEFLKKHGHKAEAIDGAVEYMLTRYK